MMTKTKIPSFLKVTFECFIEHKYFFIQHFGTIKLGEILLITEKVDCVISKKKTLAENTKFSIFLSLLSECKLHVTLQNKGSHLPLPLEIQKIDQKDFFEK